MSPRLFDYVASANCYKVRLLLAQLGAPYERVQSTSSRVRR
jgi:glutathione S-transferase